MTDLFLILAMFAAALLPTGIALGKILASKKRIGDIDPNTLRLMLDACARIHKGEYDPTQGLCFNIRMHLMQHHPSTEFFKGCLVLMDQIFASWPYFSGKHAYPIKDPEGIFDPVDAFVVLDLWDGPYGDARRALLEFTIAELTRRIGETK